MFKENESSRELNKVGSELTCSESGPTEEKKKFDKLVERETKEE